MNKYIIIPIIAMFIAFFLLGVGYAYHVELIEDYEALLKGADNVLENSWNQTEYYREQLRMKAQQKEVNYFYGVATAYHPWSGGINTDGFPDITSTNEKAEEGIIAVDPDIIPYGSEVMIISGKTVIRGVANDTGGFRFSNPYQVDILMENRQDALDWGIQNAHVIWW